jgi:hypothetical protein
MPDATLGELAEEIVDDLFLLLNLLFVFVELQEREHTSNDTFFFHVEILLMTLHGGL